MRQDGLESRDTGAFSNHYPGPTECIDVEHFGQQGHLSLIIDSAPNGMLLVNTGGVIEMVNKQVERMFGYQRSELLGKRVEILLPERFQEDHPGLRSGFHRDPSARPMGVGRDLFGRRKDGSEFPVEIGLNPIPTTAGTWVLSSLVDITERKLAEAKVQEAAQLKSQFLANMSHEIRTPMNVIIGMSSLLLEGELPPEQRGFAEMIATGAESLLTIINDILDFSKIEADKLEIGKSEFDLVATVREAAGFLADSAARKGIGLKCHVAATPCAVVGDAGRIRQVLVNIIGNAVKFTERGMVGVGLTWQTSGPKQLLARFEVRDTGIGMGQETMRSLFEPFTQADGSETRRYGGTGLGLAISKKLVELMGGEIGATSELGKGTTFWFTVPLKESSAETAPALRSTLTHCHALVVDEDDVHRKTLETELDALGITVSTSLDGPAALSLLRSASMDGKRYDVVLIEDGRPGMTGLDLARIIRSDRELANLPIILLTADSNAKRQEEAHAASVDAHLSGPVQSHCLRDALEHALTESGRRRREIARPRETAAETSAPVERPTLLLVEDNAANRQVALTLLSRLGYSCDIAVNGLDATRAVRATHYPLVLMDLQMPEMDGLAATTEIRKAEQGGPRTPIVAITANVMVGDRERCLAAGMDDYLPKPFHRHELEAILHKWLGRVENPGAVCAPVWS